MCYFPSQIETIGLVVCSAMFDQMEDHFLATQTALTCQSMYAGPQQELRDVWHRNVGSRCFGS